MAKLEDFEKLLKSVLAEWDKAESDIKIAEQLGHQVVFPAIKELRYAGRRIVDALARILANDDNGKITALLDDALFDCYRARHDAIDASISTIAAEMDVTAKKLGYNSVLKAFPDYPSLLETLAEAQEKIASSRGRREDRDAIYQAIEQCELAKVVKLYRAFKLSEHVMRSIAKEDRFWPKMGFLATIVSIVIAIVAIGVAIYFAK